MRRYSESPVARNAGFVLIGKGVSVVFQSLYFVLLAKLLGSLEYGLYAGAFALVSILSQYSTFGSATVLLRYVSQDASQFSMHWGNVLVTTILLGGAFTGIVCWFGPHIESTYSPWLLAAVAAADCLFSQLTLAAGCVFQAHQKMHVTALLNALSNVLRATAAGYLLVNQHRATAREWIWITLGIAAFCSTLSVVLVSYSFGAPTFSLRLLKRRVVEGSVFAASGSTTNIYNDVDKSMLVHYGMAVANGVYTMAYRIVEVAMTPISAVQTAAFPRFFQEANGGVKSVEAFAGRILRKTFPMSAVLALSLWFFAPVVPRILGSGFAGGVQALRILCFLPLFRALQYSARDALTGRGHQKVRLAVQAAAALFNVSANLYLIPRFGWQGAAWSSLVTDGLLGVMNWGALHVVNKQTRYLALPVTA